MLKIDLEAVILGTRLAITEMQKSRTPGVILNTASLAGLVPFGLQPVYSAAKAGVVHFSRSLAHLGKRGIRVVAICPGFSPTGIVDDGMKVRFVQFACCCVPPSMRSTSASVCQVYGADSFTKVTGVDLIPVEKVIDAFILGIEDESLAGSVFL